MAADLNAAAATIKQHQLSREQPFAKLECKKAFEALTEKEKLYVHYLSQACWAGSPIVFEQVSPESPEILNMFLDLFKDGNISSWKEATLKKSGEESAAAGLTADDITDFLVYAGCFFANHGNYLSFGDSKLLPLLSKDKFLAIVGSHYASVVDRIYSLEESERMLNFPETGVSSYYSKNVTKSDIQIAQKFMEEKGISPYNTRLFKNDNGDLEIKIAAGKASKVAELFEVAGGTRRIAVTFGDYGYSLEHVAANIEKAIPFAADETQANMLAAYVKHFREGPIDFHKEAQRFWIRDVGPVVETNIGFIESYRDPAGVRGEFEGFVAVVNKETSKKFSTLVNQAPTFLAKLPWPSEFEKDKFLKPDFTSLEVVCFSGSGIPAGINIPNYDDIRQNEGFKNVSLGNVLTAYQSKDKVSFLGDDDQKIYQELRVPSFEVQVGGHELLGHGSGKLLVEQVEGKFNFDRELIDPMTKRPVESWYLPGQQYDSVFGSLASAMEECRAECVGVVLSADFDFLKIFGHEGQEAEDILYVNWLNMARAGVLALEFYSPEQKKWRQAHMQARFGILRCMLAAGESFVTLDPTNSDPIVSLDRSKILSVGVPAVQKFLHSIQVLKSTANIAGATKLFEEFTGVPEDFLKLRQIVLEKKKPRAVFVQVNTTLSQDGTQVLLHEYEASAEGMIESYLHRLRK
eukprot:TRINITY_DN4364_c0_g1_i1.p1 TRINITY_DN4364_c0_g1~~TRINITY_DN4364_c0_g1_i1.p1  ORF type:complete len:726 (+),score=242.40 TRINITY_DN4364_c0_g1_i1:110-2179(+)